MTSVASGDMGTAHLPPGILRSVRPGDGEPDAEPPTWGWAVVEIRSDGSWGRAQVVPADEAAAITTSPAVSPPVAARLQELSPAIQAHVGSHHVSNGFLPLAVTALTRGTRARAALPARHECLGRLAHVEAFRGDLRRASRHAGTLATSPSNAGGAGAEHAQLARAWIALERADFAGTRRRLDDRAYAPSSRNPIPGWPRAGCSSKRDCLWPRGNPTPRRGCWQGPPSSRLCSGPLAGCRTW